MVDDGFTGPWRGALDTYVRYLEAPSCRPNKEARKRTSKSALGRIARLEKHLPGLVARDGFPASPDEVDQGVIDGLMVDAGALPHGESKDFDGAPWFRDFWRMFINHRFDYTCWICGRHAIKDAIPYEGDELVLRLELDHVIPRSQGGAHYKLDHIRPACRVCNTARGQMEPELIYLEMRSLAETIMAKEPPIAQFRRPTSSRGSAG